MITPDTFLHNTYRRMAKKDVATLLILFITCFFTHYYLFTHRFLNEDMIGYTSYTTRHITLGRWSEIIIPYISPSVMFLFVCILLPITAFLTIKTLGFSSRVFSILSAMICVVFPSLSYAFGYTILVAIYCITLFEAVLAVYFTLKYKYGFLPGAFLFGIACGGYQSSIGLSISLCFCLLFIALISGQPLKQCFLYALRFLSMGALGMIVYFIGMKLSLYITHLELSTYKGMSEIGKIPLASIPSLILKTYRNFFAFFKGEAFFYASGAAKLSYLLFAAFGLLCLIYALIQFAQKREFVRCLLILIFTAAAPTIFNLFDFVVPSYGASALNVYQFVFAFLWLLRWLDNYVNRFSFSQWIMSIACIIVIANFYYIDNVHYLKAEAITDRSIYLWNRILSRIEETEGYQSNMPLMIVASDSYRKEIAKNGREFSPVILNEYEQGLGAYIALGPWANHKPIVLLRNLFGVEFSGVDDKEISHILSSPDYLEMAVYPEAGSLKVINKVMVVNFDAPVTAKIAYSSENKYLTLQCETGEKIASEDFSYVWYIYHNGQKIDTIYTPEQAYNYNINYSGDYYALLFTKDPFDQYSVQRKSNTVTIDSIP